MKEQKNTLYPFWTRQDAIRKGTRSVIALKNHLQDCLTRSLEVEDPYIRQKLLTVAIAGAGATGVELAATLTDVLPQWYLKQGGKFEQLRLVLIDRSSQILSSASDRLRQAAQAALEKRPNEF